MRIYLTFGLKDDDVFPEYEYINYKDIEGAAYPAQVDEIYGPIVLNYIPLAEFTNYLAKCKKLLCIGGKLIIGGIDCYLLSRQTISRDLSEKQYNELLFSDPSFRAVHSLNSVKQLIQSMGFSIDKVNIEEDEVRFTIEASKQ